MDKTRDAGEGLGLGLAALGCSNEAGIQHMIGDYLGVTTGSMSPFHANSQV